MVTENVIMKLLHLSDLHLGKRVNEFSMLEDQAFVLDEIVTIAAREQPGAVLIAGDVYDKSVPSAEAVQLFDDFLCRLAAIRLPVMVISGNHDSAERLAFASRLISASGIFISPLYDGTVTPVTLHDDHGAVDFYLLPYIKPLHVRQAFPDEEVNSYNDALRIAVSHIVLDQEHRNVLLAHQFVTGATVAGSEELSVGGLDNVDADIFDAFDYVALGHIHGAQRVGGERVRYCGSPLKYSFAEANQHKSVTLVELGAKGEVDIHLLDLHPRRDLREIKGSFADIAARRNDAADPKDDYMHITLTDDDDVVDALAQLRLIYPNIMRLDYDNHRTRAAAQPLAAVEKKQPLELFDELYTMQNGQPMSAEQRAVATGLIEKLWED